MEVGDADIVGAWVRTRESWILGRILAWPQLNGTAGGVCVHRCRGNRVVVVSLYFRV